MLDTVARQAVATLEFVLLRHLGIPSARGLSCGTGRLYQVGDSYAAQGEVVRLTERSFKQVILDSPGPVLETLSDPGLHPDDSRASMEKWARRPACRCRCASERRSWAGVLVLGENERERRFTADELEVAEGLADAA